jgi:hypothetical protein
MEEIKSRTEIIDSFFDGEFKTIKDIPKIESICLQFRKILEIIAFSSMSANAKLVAKYHVNFTEFWNAERIFKKLHKINPDHYPKPVLIVDHHISFLTEGYLTKPQFIDIYNKCGNILHAENPYGIKKDYINIFKEIPTWRTLLIKLLSQHLIKLVDSDNFYLIIMRDSKDSKTHCYTLGPKMPEDNSKI